MDPDRDTEPAAAAVEKRQEVQPAVALDELDQFRRTGEAKRLARLEADSELMLRLSVEGFEGSTWEKVAHALVEYGFTVMRAWVVTGQVFVKLREKGRSLNSPAAGIPREEALQVAEDTVADAIVHFRDKVLKRGLWDPAKGASLTTFFIGNCLMFQFPNVYRRWVADRRRGRQIESLDQEGDDYPARSTTPRSRDDPASEVVSNEASKRAVKEILAPISSETNRTILRLRAEGFGIDEIAEILDLEYNAVESRIYRARQSIRRRGA